MPGSRGRASRTDRHRGRPVLRAAGHRGWIGARLDIAPDRDEVAEIVQDGYRLVAPKRLSALLDR
ncbi:hypothetical protein ACW9HJ_05245 [Nocardia gipuzkoensis]